MSKKTVIRAAVVLLFSVILITLLNRDLWDVNERALKKEITSIEENVETINLAEVTTFEWDVVYSFEPYTPKELIYETVGYEWDRISETVSEGMEQIVFLKDGKVVCYLFGYPENNGYGIDFSGQTVNDVAKMLKADEDLTFQVTRSNDIVFLRGKLSI